MWITRKLLGEYVCDLYKLRVINVTKDEEKFEKMLIHMLDTTYPRPDDKQSFLETYFHTFLIKGNRKYADWILKEIKKTGDEAFIHYNENAYAVMLDGRTDLIEEMDEDINSKRYYGFALGVILVMISKQYSALGDPKAVYMPVVDRYLREAEAQEQDS